MKPKTTYTFGIHAVTQWLLLKRPMIQLHVLKQRQDHKLEKIKQLATKQGIPLYEQSRQTLDTLCPFNHQGVIGIYQALQKKQDETDLWTMLDSLAKPHLLLVLDGIQDPHNLGACLRSAEALGVQGVIAPKNRAVGITPVVEKVACGATYSLPFFAVTNLARVLKSLPEWGISRVGMEASAEHVISDIELKAPIALVLGGESGMRRLTREHCDHLARIPMQGLIPSLNVSVATAIALYEVQRPC